MSLTLFFIVLSVAIGYLLYDTFKKSKQKASKTSETASNKLKINYTRECTILDTLNKQKIESIKTKTISIHLVQLQTQFTPSQIARVKQVISKALGSRRIYLLQKQSQTHHNLFYAIKQTVGQNCVIPYFSTEGAVAILRQLSCGIHLESQKQLYTKIKQYISKIWYVGQDSEEQALREFKSQLEMIDFISKLDSEEQIKQ